MSTGALAVSLHLHSIGDRPEMSRALDSLGGLSRHPPRSQHGAVCMVQYIHGKHTVYVGECMVTGLQFFKARLSYGDRSFLCSLAFHRVEHLHSLGGALSAASTFAASTI